MVFHVIGIRENNWKRHIPPQTGRHNPPAFGPLHTTTASYSVRMSHAAHVCDDLVCVLECAALSLSVVTLTQPNFRPAGASATDLSNL